MKKYLWMALTAMVLFGCSKAKVDNTNKQAVAQPSATETASYYEVTDEKAPVVYFTKDISPAGLVRAYEALGWKPNGKVGVKISTGESVKTNHLRPRAHQGSRAETQRDDRGMQHRVRRQPRHGRHAPSGCQGARLS